MSASFHNIRDGFFAGQPDARRLADLFAGSFVALAQHGRPDAAGLPEWPAYDTFGRATMAFDTECRMEDDWRGEIRQFWETMPVASTPLG